MGKKDYGVNQDYVPMAEKWQSVLSEAEAIDKLNMYSEPFNNDDIYQERLKQNYSCLDNYQMGSIQDNQIYIALTDNQHKQLLNNEQIKDLSGYFSDQATINACKDEKGVLDNTKYTKVKMLRLI